jgi:uncharacterized protein YdeI (YjbR/CyaY-like superfamily)
VQQTANVQSARQLRFTSAREVATQARAVQALIREAVQVEQAGMRVVLKETAQFSMPAEFASALRASPALKKAFEALTPGRQRGYLLHFSSAAQSATREARIARNAPRILAGKGLKD